MVAQGEELIKLTLDAAVWKDLGFVDITERDALDRTKWRQQIHVTDPKLLRCKAWFGYVVFSRCYR